MSHNPERRLSYGPGLPTDPLWLKAVDRANDGLDRGAQRLFSSMAAVARGGFYVLDGLTSFVDRLVLASLKNEGGNSLLSEIDDREESGEGVRRVARVMIEAAKTRVATAKSADRYLIELGRAKNKNN